MNSIGFSKSFEIVEHSKDAYAPVSYMLIKDIELVEKNVVE